MKLKNFQIARIKILNLMITLLICGCGGGGNPTQPPDDDNSVNLVTVNGTVHLPTDSNLQFEQLKVATVVGGTVAINSEGHFSISANEKCPLSLAIIIGPDGSILLSGLISTNCVKDRKKLILDSRSTATAMVFVTPFVATTNPTEIVSILNYMETVLAFEQLISAIENLVAEGKSPYRTDDPVLTAAFANLYGSVLQYVTTEFWIGSSREVDNAFNIEPSSQNRLWIEEIGNESKNGNFKAGNLSYLTYDVYRTPVIMGEPNYAIREQIGHLSGRGLGVPSSEEIKYANLAILGNIYPKEQDYSYTLTFLLDFTNYSQYLITMIGPGVRCDNCTEDEWQPNVIRSPRIRTFIDVVLSPLWTIITGTRIFQTGECLGKVLANSAEGILEAWNAKDSEDFYFRSVQILVKILDSLIFDCVLDKTIIGLIEGYLTIVWEGSTLTSETIMAIGEIFQYPIKSEFYITDNSVWTVSPISGPSNLKEKSSGIYAVYASGDDGINYHWTCIPIEAGTFTNPDANTTEFSKLSGVVSATLQVEVNSNNYGPVYRRMTVELIGTDFPIAIVTANPNPQVPGEPVHFDGSTSYDPDGGPICTYEWDWDNDGIWDEQGAQVNHAWDQEGIYQVQLRVTDDESAMDTLDTPLNISVTTDVPIGGSAPIWDSTIGITDAEPGDGSIMLQWGTATDPDGDNPVTYNLYYCDETATGDNNPFVLPYETIKNITSPFQLTGLINGHKYWLGVRAQDSKGLEETNTVTKFASLFEADFILVGSAQQIGDIFRLTLSQLVLPIGQSGAAWYTVKQPIENGFEISFQFQITDGAGAGGGADGIAFVIQNSSISALGGSGGAIGYATSFSPGISNSLVVEFDTFCDSFVYFDPDGNHISVQTAGMASNSPDHSYSIGFTNAIPNMKDGAIHSVKIGYVPGTLSVYLDNLTTPTLTTSVNLADTLALDNGSAWIGFTSATGAGYENHDVFNWSF